MHVLSLAIKSQLPLTLLSPSISSSSSTTSSYVISSNSGSAPSVQAVRIMIRGMRRSSFFMVLGEIRF